MTAPVGSKANPSKYDAYPNLADDEPYFVIRAHDLLSSALVELHAYIGGIVENQKWLMEDVQRNSDFQKEQIQTGNRVIIGVNKYQPKS